MTETKESQDTRYSRLIGMARGGGLRAQLLRGGLGSFVIKILSTGLAFGVAIVLARLMGPSSYGVYAYVFALISVMAVPAQLGLPTLVVRETAKAHVNERWDLMRGIWRWSNLMAAVLSLGLAMLAAVVMWLYADRFTDTQVKTFFFGLLLVPLIALGNLRGAALRGLRRVVAGQLPESVLRPTFLILLAGLFALTERPSSITAAHAMSAHVLAALAAFLIGAWLLRRSRPRALLENPIPSYEAGAWLKATLPLAMLAGIQLTNKYTDIIMLGFFRPAQDVGVYSIVAQGALLVVFGQQAVNVVIAPHFARLHAAGDAVAIERLVIASARVSMLMAVPVAIAFALSGGKILELFFGHEFAVGHTALAILSGGLIVNAKLGQVAHLLNMTGHEAYTARGMAVAALCNVVLNFLLIPPFGLNGAAVATASSIVLWNVLLWRSARKVLGISSHVFRW